MQRQLVSLLVSIGVIAPFVACSSAEPLGLSVSSALEPVTGLVFSANFDRNPAAEATVADVTQNQDGRISTDTMSGALAGVSYTTRPGGGDALDFTSGHVAVPASAALKAISAGVTLCGRVRAREYPASWGAIITRQEMSQDGPAPDFRESYGAYLNGDSLRFITNDPRQILTFNATLPLNEWTQFCATYDATTKQATGYMNCVERGTATLPGTLDNQTNNPLIIGGNHNFGIDRPVDENFLGGVDDVRVYNRALTASEVAQMCPTSPLCTPGLVGQACCTAGPTPCAAGLTCLSNTCQDVPVEPSVATLEFGGGGGGKTTFDVGTAEFPPSTPPGGSFAKRMRVFAQNLSTPGSAEVRVWEQVNNTPTLPFQAGLSWSGSTVYDSPMPLTKGACNVIRLRMVITDNLDREHSYDTTLNTPVTQRGMTHKTIWRRSQVMPNERDNGANSLSIFDYSDVSLFMSHSVGTSVRVRNANIVEYPWVIENMSGLAPGVCPSLTDPNVEHASYSNNYAPIPGVILCQNDLQCARYPGKTSCRLHPGLSPTTRQYNSCQP